MFSASAIYIDKFILTLHYNGPFGTFSVSTDKFERINSNKIKSKDYFDKVDAFWSEIDFIATISHISGHMTITIPMTSELHNSLRDAITQWNYFVDNPEDIPDEYGHCAKDDDHSEVRGTYNIRGGRSR